LKDDKILTDWNGLMIAALAKAGSALQDPRYAEAASRSARFILSRMRREDGGLIHRYRQGEAALQANLDDYAFLVWGLLELYQTTFDVSFLTAAVELNTYMIHHFWDEENKGFFFTADNSEPLLVRSKEIYDGAVPSGNSVAFYNLLRLARITGDRDLEEKAEEIERTFSQQVGQIPSAHSQVLIGLDFRIGPSFEVVIAGRTQAMDTAQMLSAIQKLYAPGKVLLFRPEEEEIPEITRIAPFTGSQRSIEGKATAYVCEMNACKEPTTDVKKVIEVLTTR
jgi:uncharacterized protein